MKHRALLSTLTAIGLACPSATAALTAGINFVNTDTVNSNQRMDSRAANDRTAGVGIYETNVWTDVNPAGFTFSNISILDSGGNTAAELNSTYTSGFNGFSGSVGAMTDSAHRTLMNAYTSYNSSDSGNISINNISSNFTSAPGGFTLVIYFDSDNNAREATFTVGAATVNGLDGSTFSGIYNEATGVGIDSNYAVFSGLTASDLTLGIDSNVGRMGVTGMTLYAVPEPSSTALLGLGGLALILRRRK